LLLLGYNQLSIYVARITFLKLQVEPNKNLTLTATTVDPDKLWAGCCITHSPPSTKYGAAKKHHVINFLCMPQEFQNNCFHTHLLVCVCRHKLQRLVDHCEACYVVPVADLPVLSS